MKSSSESILASVVAGVASSLFFKPVELVELPDSVDWGQVVAGPVEAGLGLGLRERPTRGGSPWAALVADSV
jgi:hypothetical protein